MQTLDVGVQQNKKKLGPVPDEEDEAPGEDDDDESERYSPEDD